MKELANTKALEHGSKASGYRFLRPGFGFSEVEDLAWALGWPHLRVLGPASGGDPVDLWRAAFPLPRFEVVIPRDYALGFVRGHLFCPRDWNDNKQWPDLAADRIRASDQVSDAEARELISLHFDDSEASEPFHWYVSHEHIATLIYALEAFVGPEVLADQLVRILETLPTKKLAAEKRQNRFMAHMPLFFLLKRSRVEISDALRLRVAAVLDRVVSEQLGGELSQMARGETLEAYRMLDIIAHAEVGIRRAGPPEWAPARVLLTLADDADWIVREMAATGVNHVDQPQPRLLFSGGPGAVDIERSWVRAYRHPEKKALVTHMLEWYGTTPAALPVLASLHEAIPGSRKRVEAWCKAHAAQLSPRMADGEGGSWPLLRDVVLKSLA